MEKKLKSLIIITPIILFLILAICIKAEIGYGLENKAYYEIIELKSDAFTNVVKTITNLGNKTTIIIMCLVLFIFRKTRIKIALPVAFSVISSGITNITLKEIFARERPNILQLVSETSYSFPSGHAMINTSIYTMLILLTLKYVKNRRSKILLVTIFTLMPILIGLSRVYLGVHYIGDVIGGFLLGFSVAAIAYIIWNKLYFEKIEKIKYKINC